MNSFESLGLSPTLLNIIGELGYKEPTPIQEKAIPYLLSAPKSDFIGLAQTGTGKTAAFGLPLIDIVDVENKATQALIMAPTRELGQQTAQQLEAFSANHKRLNVEVVYGGAAISNQIKALKSPTQIVVATPGRLLDLIRRKAIKLNDVKYVVLDEADEMLNMGFKEDIDEILSYTRDDRSTWLFSATMPAEIRKIVKKYMTEPREVAVNTKEKTNTDITHQYIVTRTSDKVSALRRFLDLEPEMRGILFCRTRRETQEITDQLIQLGYEVEALHGELSQAQRDAAMRRFKARNMQLLIATDVAARGIDVNDLTHVLHHKLPDQLEAYTHRSGRTGRAGNKGISIAFINSREGRRIAEIEKKIKVKFEKIDVPHSHELKEARLKNWVKRTLEMPIDAEAKKSFEKLKGHFEALNKEDVLLRFLTQELATLKDSEGGDLNISEGSEGKGRDGRERRENHNGPFRYFINLGKNDGLDKRDLLDFITEISGAKRKHVGDIAIQDKRSFFDLDQSQAEGFEGKFVGLELDNGHAIKVNREGNRNEERGRRRDNRGGRSDRYGGRGGSGRSRSRSDNRGPRKARGRKRG